VFNSYDMFSTVINGRVTVGIGY